MSQSKVMGAKVKSGTQKKGSPPTTVTLPTVLPQIEFFFPACFEFFHVCIHKIRSTHRMTTIFYSTYLPMSEEHFSYP